MKADVAARMAADTAKMEARIKELEDRLMDVGMKTAHERRLYNEVLSARSFSVGRAGSEEGAYSRLYQRDLRNQIRSHWEALDEIS